MQSFHWKWSEKVVILKQEKSWWVLHAIKTHFCSSWSVCRPSYLSNYFFHCRRIHYSVWSYVQVSSGGVWYSQVVKYCESYCEIPVRIKIVLDFEEDINCFENVEKNFSVVKVRDGFRVRLLLDGGYLPNVVISKHCYGWSWLEGCVRCWPTQNFKLSMGCNKRKRTKNFSSLFLEKKEAPTAAHLVHRHII
jgi:hypothetical protein